VRIDLKVKRAAVFNVAGRLFASKGDLRSLDELPSTALVVSDVRLDVLLDFCGRNRFCDRKNLILFFLLFPVHLAFATHATMAGVACFF